MLERDPGGGKGSTVAEAYRKAGPYLSASSQLTSSVGLWTVVGYFLDRKLGTTPWCLLVGSLLGMALGFYLFLRTILALGAKEKADAANGSGDVRHEQ